MSIFRIVQQRPHKLRPRALNPRSFSSALPLRLVKPLCRKETSRLLRLDQWEASMPNHRLTSRPRNFINNHPLIT